MIEQIDPAEAYALYVLRKLSSEEMVSLADAWLNQGMFTESLNQLCWSKDTVFSELVPLFEQAMRELGIKQPGRREAAELLIRKILHRVVNSELPPVAGAELIYWDIYSEFSKDWPNEKYAGDSLGLEYILCWLREIWDCRDGSIILYYNELPRREAEEKFIQHLIEESRKWLEKNPESNART